METVTPVLGGSALLPVVGLAFAALFVVALLGVGAVLVVVVVANRAEPDATGRRPFVVYSFGVAFVTVWAALIGAVTIVASLVDLAGTTNASLIGVPSALHPVGDATARGVVLGAIVLVVSGLTFVLHLKKATALVANDPDPASPARRVERSYLAAVAFTSVLIAVVALVVAVYAVFSLAGPGVFGASGRVSALRTLIDAAFVALAAGSIALGHLRRASPPLWPWRSGRDGTSPTG